MYQEFMEIRLFIIVGSWTVDMVDIQATGCYDQIAIASGRFAISVETYKLINFKVFI